MIAQVVALRLNPAGRAGDDVQLVIAPPVLVGVHAVIAASLVKLFDVVP